MALRLLNRISAFRLMAFALTGLIALTALLAPSSLVRAQSDGDELTGDYTVAINSEEIPTDVANAEMVVGRWRISFQNGVYEAERLDLGVLIQGSYELDGDSVTITDESGIISCSNPTGAADGETDVASATYTFERDDNNLAMTPVEDGCGLRRILLSSKEFQVFVACLTGAIPVESDATSATEDDDGDEITPTPESKGASPLDVLSIDATPESGSDEEKADARESQDIEAEIDGLLGQLTACWATGDPARFLPLWSEDFRDAFLSGDEDENQAAIGSLQAAMQVPITWERAGDIDQTSDESVEAVVRTTTLDEEEFVRYLFVFEDGAWRWDGAAG